MSTVTDGRRFDAREAWATWRGSLLLLPACLYFFLSRGDYTVLDSADLIIHEAGHFFFRFFGDFAHMAGGTLMQVILPSVIVWHFYAHSYPFGVQVGLFWLGQNFVNISVYAADARAQVLPLLGGPHARHDWHYLLGRLGLLPFDAEVGLFFMVLAAAAFLAALAAPRYVW